MKKFSALLILFVLQLNISFAQEKFSLYDVNADYVVLHINYSKENKNEKFFKEYKNPGRLGYPSFLVLNDKGDLLHIQDSGYLEKGKGYSEEKVTRFLLLWNKFSTQ